jgi:hypothetical protein
MRLCHPPDGSTSPKYKLLCFITAKKFCKEKNALALNRDRCCHLVLCLWLIPFHCCYVCVFCKSIFNKELNLNKATHFIIVLIRANRGSSEKVSKIKFLKKKIEENIVGVKFFMIINFQNHLYIEKINKL